MFKELISTMLVATMPVNNTTYNSLTNKNTYYYTSASYDDSYYTNEELESWDAYDVLEYNTASFGSNFTIKARGLQKRVRYIAENIYSIHQDIYIKVENTASLDIERIQFTINPTIPNETAIDTSQTSYQLYTYSAVNPLFELFMSNQLTTLNNYNQLNDTATSLQNGNTIDDTTAFSEVNEVYKANATTAFTYMRISLQWYYDYTKITDNGSFIQNISTPLTEIQEEITYALPTTTDYEVIDLPGLMFEILGMPLAFVSMAFNFTIFPGTPYALNISHLIMAVIVSCIAIFIIKRILK